jgi:hypothetical protein
MVATRLRFTSFDSEAWFAMGANPAQQVALAWHEALLVSEEEGSDNYGISYLSLTKLSQVMEFYSVALPFKSNPLGIWDCVSQSGSHESLSVVELKKEGFNGFGRYYVDKICDVLRFKKGQVLIEECLKFASANSFTSQIKNVSCQGLPEDDDKISAYPRDLQLTVSIVGFNKMKVVLPHCTRQNEPGSNYYKVIKFSGNYSTLTCTKL